MNTSKKQIISWAVLFSAAILSCGQASATTVTYNFDETGWINTFGTTENFFGYFSGTADATGNLNLADLSIFSATITETNAQNDTKTIATFGSNTGTTGLTDFLFTTATNALTLAASGSPGATICLGTDVQQGLCGPVAPRPVSITGVPAPPLEGLFLSSVNGALNAYTTNLPAITMQPTPVGSTPEPASFALCGGALLFASVALRRYRKSSARPVPAEQTEVCVTAG